MRICMWMSLLALVACQNQTSVIKQKKKLTVSPNLVDFGSLTVNDTATATIDLTHVAGDDVNVVTLSILNVAGAWISTDESYHPTISDTDEITVTYHPEEEGYHRARLTITTDEEDQPNHVVELRGVAAYPSADIYPPVIDFGPVVSGDTATASVTLVNSGTVRLDLAGLSFDDSHFSSRQKATSLNAGETLEIPVEFAADNERPISGQLDLDLGAAPARSVELRANDCENGDVSLYDADSDGITSCGGDCDDQEPASYPGAAEVCDAADNDCDGTADNGTTCYDDDGDGVTELDGDCNDADATVHPGVKEDYSNGKDDDCDGMADYGDLDLDGDGYSSSSGDCDDTSNKIYPGAKETEDGADNDCDGVADDGTNAFDDDGDGYAENLGDCDDGNPGIYPGARERADGLDNDCDGTADEGTVDYDDDGDGFSENGGDCDDKDATTNPAAVELVGDGVDNDCDGIAK